MASILPPSRFSAPVRPRPQARPRRLPRVSPTAQDRERAGPRPGPGPSGPHRSSARPPRHACDGPGPRPPRPGLVSPTSDGGQASGDARDGARRIIAAMHLILVGPDAATVEVSESELGLVQMALNQELGFSEPRPGELDPEMREGYNRLRRSVASVLRAIGEEEVRRGPPFTLGERVVLSSELPEPTRATSRRGRGVAAEGRGRGT